MDWITNLLSYCTTRDVGKCPKCGKNSVSVQENIHGERKSLTFTCKECNAFIHFDGASDKKTN